MRGKSRAGAPRKAGPRGKLALKKRTLKDLPAGTEAKGGGVILRSLGCSVNCLRTRVVCKTG
jgi:hypothetical protein